MANWCFKWKPAYESIQKVTAYYKIITMSLHNFTQKLEWCNIYIHTLLRYFDLLMIISDLYSGALMLQDKHFLISNWH